MTSLASLCIQFLLAHLDDGQKVEDLHENLGRAAVSSRHLDLVEVYRLWEPLVHLPAVQEFRKEHFPCVC